jgi:hypothetical protein
MSKSNSFSNGPGSGQAGPYAMNPLTGCPNNWIPGLWADGLLHGAIG